MTLGVPLRYPVNVLVSFHYFARADLTVLTAGGLRVIGDSGAFSSLSQGASIDLDTYAAWSQKWRQHLCWSASLDVIGNADGSWRNWLHLTAGGGQYVPTVHYGDDPTVLDRYGERGVDFVGLGGMVSRKSEPARLLRWAVTMFRHARDRWPTMRFHGWGITHPLLLNSLPWYSVDSSGWGSAYRFARLSLFDPRTGGFQAINLNTRQAYKHGRLLRSYGVEPSQVVNPRPAARGLLCRLSAASYQALEDRLRRRAHVPAPTYGLNPGSQMEGPNVHLADTDERLTLSHLYAARPTGPNVHLAGGGRGIDGEYDHLFSGPNVHLASGDVQHLLPGPHLHLADSDHTNLGNLSDPGPHVHLADGKQTSTGLGALTDPPGPLRTPVETA